ncbi:MAG: hypothetical protein H7Y36_03940 [Armatimonadetes bacterium]|nr:hypothetical protein [Akkermansiaceae bacterium]
MNDPETNHKNPLEWCVFGVSLLVTIGTIGYLIVGALQRKSGPPVLEVNLGKATAADSWVRVPVSVKNSGHSVAAGVEVQVAAMDGSSHQSATLKLDFIPIDAERHGAVLFKAGIDPTTLKCEVIGYQNP